MTEPTVPTEEQLARYLGLLAGKVREAHQMLEKVERWAVQPGSSLLGDDRASNPYQISHVVRSQLGVGLDHLLATVHLLDAGVLHPMAPFTLIRSALETTATGLWVLEPAARSERITRRMQLAAIDINDGDQATEGAGLAETTPKAERIARVQELTRAARGRVEVVAARPVSTSAIMAVANEASGSVFDALLAWRVCSGLAHGRQWAHLRFLAREPVSASTSDGVTELRITSDSGRLVWALGAAVDLVDVVIGRYDQRAQSPY